MIFKRQRSLESAKIAAQLIAEHDTTPVEHKPHQTWVLNWPLLIGSIAVSLLLVFVAWFGYQRQEQTIAAGLLTLADQAEAKQDWPLATSRLHRYLKRHPDDIAASKRLADIYYQQATTFDEINAGLNLYSRCLSASEKEDLQLKLRYLTMLARIYPTESLDDLEKLLPRNQKLIQTIKHKPDLTEALRLRIHVLEHELPTKLDKEQTIVRKWLIEDYEALAAVEPDNHQLPQNLAFLYQQHASTWKDQRSRRSRSCSMEAEG